MTDLHQEVVSGLERMSGMADRLEAHDQWLTSLERWVSSCVKTLANFGAQPLDSAEPGASGTVEVLGSLMGRIEVQTVMDWIASVADVPDGRHRPARPRSGTGGPAVAAERRRLVERAQRHRDPAELGRLYDAMQEHLTAWRALRV
jgi:hypothetical protein